MLLITELSIYHNSQIFDDRLRSDGTIFNLNVSEIFPTAKLATNSMEIVDQALRSLYCRSESIALNSRKQSIVEYPLLHFSFNLIGTYRSGREWVPQISNQFIFGDYGFCRYIQRPLDTLSNPPIIQRRLPGDLFGLNQYILMTIRYTIEPDPPSRKVFPLPYSNCTKDCNRLSSLYACFSATLFKGRSADANDNHLPTRLP